jgi:hypothetical protein
MENYNECQTHKYKDGKIAYKEYFLNDKYHRTDGPAYIEYFHSGNISLEIYYVYGVIHREIGPAYNSYYERYAGSNFVKQYLINGKLHRIDGPAFIRYKEDKSIEVEWYYLLGNEVLKEQFYTPGFVDSFILEKS